MEAIERRAEIGAESMREKKRERWKAKRDLNHAERETDKNRGKDAQKSNVENCVANERNVLKRAKKSEKNGGGGKRSRE